MKTAVKVILRLYIRGDNSDKTAVKIVLWFYIGGQH